MNSLKVDWIARAGQLTRTIRNFVGGQWVEVGGQTKTKFGPRDGLPLYEIGTSEQADIDFAVAEARASFEQGQWPQSSPAARKAVLKRLADLVRAYAEELALLESLDCGKPISDALAVDIPTAANIIDFYAEAADKLESRVFNSDLTGLSYQLRRPYGVVAAIVGWNFPLVLAAGKLGAALATGNSLVLKPSELTSLSTARVAELAIEAGVPPGAFNVVHGPGSVGSALAHHIDVDVVTFTGSTSTGKRILVASGRSNLKRVILECGGKSPNIVFPDSPDLEGVAANIASRAFWNRGQVCTASSRVLVHESIKNELLDMLIEITAKMAVGDPLDPATRSGAVTSREHQRKIENYVAIGKSEGARSAFEQVVPPELPNGGFYLGATVFDDVEPDHAIAREEIFGPVLCCLSFADEAEAVRIANATTYGLSAVVWTKDLGRAHRVSQGLASGWTVVNATSTPKDRLSAGALPVSGHRQSGLGVEGGFEGLEEYRSRTAIQMFV